MNINKSELDISKAWKKAKTTKEETIEYSRTRLLNPFQTAVHLFDPMAAALGPQEAASEFVPALLKLMGPEAPSAPPGLPYHKRFLLMLQVPSAICDRNIAKSW